MKENSLAKKFITCTVSSLTTIALLLMLGNSGTFKWFPPPVVFSLVAICFLASLIYPVIWHQREKNRLVDSNKIYGLLYTTIRYTIAFNLAAFGWKKIFGLQFVVPASIAANPMNEQPGEWLTWYYFGYSNVFGMILALIQIAGAWLLLFRKTFLVAAIILFAFMLNLTLINICYQMNAGALTMSLLLTLGIAFLILVEYKRLVEFFLIAKPVISSVHFKSERTKNIIRLSAILLSLVFTLYIKYIFKASQHL